MTPDTTDDSKNDSQLPTMDSTPLNLQAAGPTDIPIPVPGEVIEAGSSTNVPPADSPETPDAVMNDGTGQVDSLAQPLAEDNQTPFSPPTDPVNDAAMGLDSRTDAGQIDPTHQATDSATNIDSQQLYDEGLAGAAEASEPNAGNAVTNYNPEEDTRNA